MSAATKEKDIKGELAYQAKVAETIKAEATSPEVLQRYREHKHAHLYQKEHIFLWIEKLKAKRVLDFGCGTGTMACQMALVGHRVVGIDLSPENIAIAQEKARLDKVTDKVEFLAADATDPQVINQKFDLVVAQSILHHIDIEKGLDMLHTLVQPGGYIILQEPFSFLKALSWVRDRTPVEKDISPNERQLEQVDLDLISKKFELVEIRYYRILTRLMRLVPSGSAFISRTLHWMDYLLLKIPGMRNFAGIAIMLCRRRP